MEQNSPFGSTEQPLTKPGGLLVLYLAESAGKVNKTVLFILQSVNCWYFGLSI
jgi:hypothetical protein